jgi:hypothetical protein
MLLHKWASPSEEYGAEARGTEKAQLPKFFANIEGGPILFQALRPCNVDEHGPGGML